MITGTVYGVMLNVAGGVEALGGAVHEAPYKAPPVAPILYIKTANTFLESGGAVEIPHGIDELEVQPSLGVVFARTATRVSEPEALDYVAGVVPVIDVCVPHASLYRPAVRHRCRDGFLPVGKIVPWPAGANAFEVEVSVNGEVRGGFNTAELVRPIPRLIAEVTDFMTLSPGDVLLVGLGNGSPRARAGDQVIANVVGVGPAECRLVAGRAA